MIREVSKNEIIEELAGELKDKLNAPSWAAYVKTGSGRERPPIREDWWNVRAASILLKINENGPIGTSKLSLHYGNKKNRGMKPEEFRRGSRNIIRKILQQLESAKLVEQGKSGNHIGRIVTKEGIKIVNEAEKKANKANKKEKGE